MCLAGAADKVAAATQQLLQGTGASQPASDALSNGDEHHGSESSDSVPNVAQSTADAGSALALVLGLEDSVVCAALRLQVGSQLRPAVPAQDVPAGPLETGGACWSCMHHHMPS